MNKTILGFLFIILSLKMLQAQTVLIGGGSGVNLILLDNGGQFGLPLYVSGSSSLNQIFELDIRIGISGAEYYNGPEFGTYLKIFPKEIQAYLIGGIKFHANSGDGGISHHIRDDLYILPTLGVGSRTKIDKTFITFELLYQIPFPQGLTYAIISTDQYYYPNDFFGVVSLNIGLAWEL